jgi:uncharacterized protein YegL
MNLNSSLSPSQDVCSICLRSLKGNGALFITECNHAFHYSCLVTSAAYGYGKCPNCRRQLVENPLHPFGNLGISPSGNIPNLQRSSRARNAFPFGTPPSFRFEDDKDDSAPAPFRVSRSSPLQVIGIPEYDPFSIDGGNLACLARVKTSNSGVGVVRNVAVDLIAVLDVSGSMIGEKMQLMKDSMHYLVEQLTPSDRISIVSFSSSAKRITPLISATTENKANIIANIDEMKIENSTNIGKGLNRGWKILKNRRFKNPISAILLLTDGCDDSGSLARIELCDKITNEIMNTEEKEELTSVFCFGYGNDHDAELLRAVSDTGNGLFYYVGDISRLNEVFGKCIGGLISTVATKISITVTSSVPIRSVDGVDGNTEIKIPNFYEGETKDFVIELSVPVSSDPIRISFACSYRAFPSITDATAVSFVDILRGSEVLAPPNLEVNKQKNRIITSKAIQEAMEKGDSDDLPRAKQILEDAIQAISTSPSASDVFCVNLIQELTSMKLKLDTREGFSMGGRQLMLSSSQSHVMQRSTGLHSDIYSTPSQILTQTSAREYRSSIVHASTHI